MSTNNSHVRFVIKETKTKCGQNFFVTNYPDLLIRDTIVNGELDRDLISRELPKDELNFSNFITNRMISFIMRYLVTFAANLLPF